MKLCQPVGCLPTASDLKSALRIAFTGAEPPLPTVPPAAPPVPTAGEPPAGPEPPLLEPPRAGPEPPGALPPEVLPTLPVPPLALPPVAVALPPWLIAEPPVAGVAPEPPLALGPKSRPSELHAASPVASIEKSANELEKERHGRFMQAPTVTRRSHLCQRSIADRNRKIFSASPKSSHGWPAMVPHRPSRTCTLGKD